MDHYTGDKWFIHAPKYHQGLYSLSGKTSYRKI